jgi:hypothetical protein
MRWFRLLRFQTVRLYPIAMVFPSAILAFIKGNGGPEYPARHLSYFGSL